MLAARDELNASPQLLPKELLALDAAGMKRVGDLLDHFPKRYEDRRRFDLFPTIASGRPVSLRGTVVDAASRRFGAGSGFYEAVVMDGAGGVFGSGKITLRWFNMPYIGKMIAAGQEVCVYGTVKELKGRLIIDHPEFEVIRDDGGGSLHLERIVPIYRNISGIAQRRLREIIHQLLCDVDPASLEGPLESDGVIRRADAYRMVHFPESLEQARESQRRFALEEFFALQLNVLWRKARHEEREGRVLGKNTVYLKRFHESLPFDLTGAQKRTIKEILADMRSPRPMNRLVQGDVGSGKTFVAMAAMLLAIGSGCQAALMAPTQILAEQHYLTFRRWLDPLGVRIALRTGSRDESSHLELEGKAQIVIGTHALLYDDTLFADLGLVVIDEQHKFGVEQRVALVRQGRVPDVLVMTATPIPRTLTMTIHGDLEVSILDEKPPGRGRIITGVRVGAKQQDITNFVKSQLSEGRQAYLVYPLVDESEKLKVESATEAHAKWSKRLAGYQVGLIHGKLKPEEKEEAMRKFRDGETAVIVATTVIEVGVDVPNASVMILHHAERFGLAQIHQLRGRIGRGGHKGYCVLLTDGKSPEALEKLKVLEASGDGFEIAEADLRMRGPGDLLGTMQSGLGDLRFAGFLSDIPLLREARELAGKVLLEDAAFEGRHRKLRELIQSQETAESREHRG